MDQTTLKMAMAGFFHDIGKFADKETMGVSDQYFNDNAGIYAKEQRCSACQIARYRVG